MERIGLATRDPHLKQQLAEMLGELAFEFELFELPELVAQNSLAEIETGSKASLEASTEPRFRFVIFDSRYGTPLSKLREDHKLSEVPWLAIGLDEHARDPHARSIHGADDLILLPLDRSVLLQKVEYLLAGQESVTPSFLFLAKAQLQIELAKQIHITHISETGCTIQASRPVAPGVEGTLVCNIFGEGSLSRVEIRAMQSQPIFETSIASLPGAGPSSASADGLNFEVRLRFFGLKHRQLQNVRRWVAAHLPAGQSIPEIRRCDDEPKSTLHVALISPQQALGSLLSSSLEQLAKIEIDGFGGFQRYHAALSKRASQKSPSGGDEKQAAASFLPWSVHFVGPKTRDEAAPLLPKSPMILHMRVPTDVIPGTFERISPPLKPDETLFARPGPTWTQDVAPLFKFFSPADRAALEEAILWTTSNSTSTQRPETSLTLEMVVSETKRQRLVFKISQTESSSPSKSALVKFQVSEAPEVSEPAQQMTNVSHASCEAVMIDASLLSMELVAKLAALSEWLETFDIRNTFGNRPPIIIFNANEEKIQAAQFRGTAARQLAYDFNDRRFQAEMFISLSRPELWTSPELSISNLKTDLKAYLSRPAKASAVSEVSLTVIDRVPLKKGTELLVMSPVWSHAPEGLWARLRFVSGKDGHFENEFIFFGVSDLVQKEIRKFARDEYIKKKAQA